MAHDVHPGNPARVGRFGTTHGGRNLNDEAAQWPTPRCEDGECAGGHRGKDDTLYGAIVRPKAPRNWSTPNGDDANNGTRASGEFKSLTRDVQTPWATPVRGDGDSAGNRCLEGSNAPPGITLTDQVQRGQSWATPASRDFRHPNAPDGESRQRRAENTPKSGDQLPNQIGGTLSPAWVCLLMGWPIAQREDGSWWCWTSLDPAPANAGFPGWPMGMGPDQWDYEPPRIAPKGSVPGRVAQIKAAGNGVVPHQAAMAFGLLLAPAIPFLEAR